MPLNLENAPMDLPDFARGEATRQVEKAEFLPLFDAAKKFEMTSDIVFDAPVVEQPKGDTTARCSKAVDCILPDTVQGQETTDISLVEHQGIIDDLKKKFESELNALREWHQNQVLHQLEMFKSGLFEDLSKQLENKVAEALSPMVEKCVARNTVDALIKQIRSIAGNDALKSIHLSGPPLLTSAVKRKMAGSQLIVKIEETDDIDLVVRLNDNLISTRLKEWSRKIETAIL